MSKIEKLAIVSHPDDESFFLAGYLLDKPGVSHVVCLTNGSKGKTNTVSSSELKDLRRAEFASATIRIGSTNEMLDLPDGGLDIINTVPVVMELLRLYVPSQILSINEAGITGHSDHINLAYSIFLAIINLLARDEEVPKHWIMPFEEDINRYFDRYYSERIKIDASSSIKERKLEIDLNPNQIASKLEAARCHFSQQHWIDHLEGVGYLSRRKETYLHLKIGNSLCSSLYPEYRDTSDPSFPLLRSKAHYAFLGALHSYSRLKKLATPYALQAERLLKGKRSILASWF